LWKSHVTTRQNNNATLFRGFARIVPNCGFSDDHLGVNIIRPQLSQAMASAYSLIANSSSATLDISCLHRSVSPPVFGSVLILISLIVGKFKIFGAEIDGTVGKTGRAAAFVLGLGMIVVSVMLGDSFNR
jgi:hypothetical protein